THWATTIDQSVWFHRPAAPEAWMLFDQRSTAAADGRGLNEGEIYAADGTLLMTCAQESVLRAITPDARPPA
ncbi:MAG: acyl-CoA thioesterase II, partial [Actinomycetota bacterium]